MVICELLDRCAVHMAVSTTMAWDLRLRYDHCERSHVGFGDMHRVGCPDALWTRHREHQRVVRPTTAEFGGPRRDRTLRWTQAIKHESGHLRRPHGVVGWRWPSVGPGIDRNAPSRQKCGPTDPLLRGGVNSCFAQVESWGRLAIVELRLQRDCDVPAEHRRGHAQQRRA